MFRALPEVNRICSKAARDRAYEQHLAALRNMKPLVNTRKPQTPQSIGRNCKRYENEKQRCSTVLKDNQRLEGKMHDIQKQEHFPRVLPQRPYTLQGQYQKDEMARIDYENKKLLKAIETRKPTLNRTEWTRHRLDHTYQITKMSEFKKSVPMSDIVREEYRSSMSRPHTTMSKWGSQTSPSKSEKSQTEQSDDFAEEENNEQKDLSLRKEVNEAVEDGKKEKEEQEKRDEEVEKEMEENNEFSLTGQVNEA
ncbi:Splicing factor, putative, partial [Trichomonas vaginalis G3]